MELTLATAYYQVFMGNECIVLLRSSRVNLNQKTCCGLQLKFSIWHSKYILEKEKGKTNKTPQKNPTKQTEQKQPPT